MKPTPPGAGRRAGVRYSGNYSASPSYTAPDNPSTFTRLDDLVRVEVIALWWRMRRLGVELPPEPDIILLNGNKS